LAQFTAEVFVVLKPLVNDPEGLVIRDALRTIGFNEVTSVRSGKYLTIEMDAEDAAEADARATQMCDKLLANPVIEEYRFTIKEASATNP
jgi:phosphoribosylformylglycinamidine synthase PurS subunit